MKFKIFCTFILFCFFSHLAVAAVSLSGTRVIYPQGKKEIALEIKNHGTQPVLTQNWIDDGNIHASPDVLNIPFIITPPIARINPEQGQTLRISVMENMLPRDKESVFWVNVLKFLPSIKRRKINFRWLSVRASNYFIGRKDSQGNRSQLRSNSPGDG
ncbi:fimbria/pilus periplasmic chaperone [Enterobacter hormaechei]|nr:fimbria/pilus periplasmic chaperone [Enterobacter hormaechei]